MVMVPFTAPVDLAASTNYVMAIKTNHGDERGSVSLDIDSTGLWAAHSIREQLLRGEQFRRAFSAVNSSKSRVTCSSTCRTSITAQAAVAV